VGSHGSIPWRMLVAVPAFVVLTLIKLCSLGLDRWTPRNLAAKKGKVVRLKGVRKVFSIGLDTAWVVGAGIVAGLPLLT
jgi:hypothetical protein